LVKFACLGKKLLIFKEKLYFFLVGGSSIFETAVAEVKIASSLKSNHHDQAKLVQILGTHCRERVNVMASDTFRDVQGVTRIWIS